MPAQKRASRPSNWGRICTALCCLLGCSADVVLADNIRFGAYRFEQNPEYGQVCDSAWFQISRIDRGMPVVLIKFLDSSDTNYVLIDSLWTESPFSWIGDTAAYYVGCGDTSCCHVIFHFFMDGTPPDTIVSLCGEARSAWRYPSWFDFSYQDSLLAYFRADWDSSGIRHDVVRLLRIKSRTQVDTIVAVPSTWMPSFSEDGTELYMHLCNSSTPDTISYGLLVYDIASGAISEPFRQDIHPYWPYRRDKQSPLYCLGEESGTTNLWKYSPGREPVRVTNVEPQYNVVEYQIREDSVFYRVVSGIDRSERIEGMAVPRE
jgi:hypothetical protein